MKRKQKILQKQKHPEINEPKLKIPTQSDFVKPDLPIRKYKDGIIKTILEN